MKRILIVLFSILIVEGSQASYQASDFEEVELSQKESSFGSRISDFCGCLLPLFSYNFYSYDSGFNSVAGHKVDSGDALENEKQDLRTILITKD